ncbi:sensor histidine kinase [Falsigemmobacter faecalis]|uniref:histidine kinase n=1 Tax=Falsigemmobacter faecalis TaxID=2488730 RepID=A0A3P3DW51_9RHOB|nr:HAMP domain-containing sensor histidine kinase [Falsigemmobacter faecalis]RRH76908.1 response regulator [Falsigemmobacter faecalis]
MQKQLKTAAPGGAQQLTLWLLTLVALPLGGLVLAGQLAVWPERPELLVVVASACTHGVLLALIRSRREGDTPRFLAGSGLALLVLLSGHLLSLEGVPELALIPAAAAWCAGGVLMLLLQAMARGMPEIGDPGGSINVKLTGAIMGVVILTAGFWVVGGMGDLMERRLPGLGLLGLCAALSLLPLAAAGPARRALGRVHREGAGKGVQALLIPIGVPALLLSVQLLPDIAFLPLGSTAVLALLGAALFLLLVGNSSLPDMAAALILPAAAPLAVACLIPAPLPMRAMAAVLVLATLAALFLRERVRPEGEQRAIGLPQPRVLVALQERLNILVLRVNFDSGAVHFPFGGGEPFGGGYSLPLTDFLRLTEMKVALDLMQKLQRGEQPADFPMRFRLRAPGAPGEARQEWTRQLFSVRVLENRYPQCWIVLERQSQEADVQRERAEQSELLLYSALSREERLRIAVARDLRAPVSVLQEEVEHLTSGRPWAESARAFALSLRLLSDSLDQLRSGAGTSRGLTGTGPWDISEMLGWLSETFASQAKYAGVALHFVPARQGDLRLHGDHGRIFLALCRLIDNAIAHARSTEISVSGFLTRGQGQEATVTWLVRDNGVGIDHLRQASLFEPFGLISGGIDGQARLGLFAVRKSLRQLGGNVVLEEASPDRDGSCFIVTHPARVLHVTEPEEERDDITALMPMRRALLLEDDPVAAEVLSARLRGLFGRVDVLAERDALLPRLRVERPDVLFVGRGTGSTGHGDLIRALRREDRTLPVIGVVSPAMPELREAMEQGGATRVLTKPVGLTQLRDLVIDLFASGSAEAEVTHAADQEGEAEIQSFLSDFQRVIGQD